MKPNKYFVIDFDSTFTRVEAFDALAEISLDSHPDRENLKNQIKDITNKGMDGSLSFRESLEQRLKILSPNQGNLKQLVVTLKGLVSASFMRNKEFFERYADRIFIISNGFHSFIDPIVTEYGIRPENIFANRFIYDDQGNVVGFDKDNPLSINNGKVETLKKLNLPGDVYVIGDGYTDYEIKASGLANKFYAFTENVEREKVLSNTDHVAPSLEKFF